jgi:CHAT domain-containing protein
VFVIRKDITIEESAFVIEDYGRNQCMSDLIKIRDSESAQENTACVDNLLIALSEKLLARILPYLAGIKEVVFIPYSLFNMLPLQAMFVSDGGPRKYIIDDYLIRFSPSAKLLKECMGRNREINGQILAVCSNPQKDLFFAEYEADVVKKLFPDARLVHEPSKNDLPKIGHDASVLHFTGHSGPAGLILSQQEMIAAEDIADNVQLSQCYLATLSACGTGYVPFSYADEGFGIHTAFMLAGAPTVVCSLWHVSDYSTALLMAKMYQGIKDGIGRAESLRQSQLWLRKSTRKEHLRLMEDLGLVSETGLRDTLRFSRGIRWERHLPEDLSHPFYWAGFICSGAP